MKTLFENQNLIAVHKPAGWLSVPSTQGKADPRPVVGIELQKQLGSVFPVHRLDFEVGGVLLFAKNSREQTRLQGLCRILPTGPKMLRVPFRINPALTTNG